MKVAFLSLIFLVSFNSFATIIKSTKNNKITVSRIDKVINLVDKEGIKVNVVVEDFGGSTDVSPTQKIFFTLYSKGEMFSTDAAFDLGYAYKLSSAKRIAGGVYEVKALVPDADGSLMKNVTVRIDAVKAIQKIKGVQCEEIDCEASENFEAVINVSSK